MRCRQARSWRLAFFGALGLSTCLTAGIIWQGARGSIIPWVVQVDKHGEAQAVAPADVGYTPSDPQVAFHLARFHRELVAYATALNGGEPKGAPTPERLVAPMIERFISTDRSYAKARREHLQA